MRRATLAGVILCLISATLAAAELQTTIRKAQELIRDGQFVETITLLERALPDARGDGVLLTLLRQAYRGEIQNRQAAGDAAAVRKYMDRLGLLEDAAARGNDSWKSVEPSVGAGDDNVKVVMPEKDLMPDAATRPKPPTTSTASGWKRATKPILNEELARRAAPTPNNDSSRETNAPSASTARTADLPSVTLRSARAVERKPTTAVAEPDAARKLDATRGLLTQADLLFVAREYAAAEPLYAKANGESSDLPSDAKARWAYCRLAAVVDQMNQQPASFDEWSAIRAELDAILKLAPSNEFALSLLTTAKRHIEQTGPAFAARSNPEAVIRANEPERADAKPSNLLADLAARIGLASSADGSKRPLWQRFRSGKWQVLETSNFRVHYTDENLGGQAADIAEATRIEVYRTWFGKLPESNWSPKCDIFIHDSPDEYTRITRQGPGSPGHSQTGIDRGRITSRRVDLRRDGHDLIAAVLPHEITHVVLADRFTAKPMPRWADEGVAVLTEPAEKKQAHLRNLGDISRFGRLFTARQLMTMTDYPPGNQWPMFYAESVSLVEFLASRDGPAKFIEFMEASQKSGYESALKTIYGLDGFNGLDREWSRGRVEQVAAATK